jgi:hypothetical protein
MASTKGMNVLPGKSKKWIAVLTFLLLLFLVISQPVQMAAFATGLFGWLHHAASALGTFVRNL